MTHTEPLHPAISIVSAAISLVRSQYPDGDARQVRDPPLRRRQAATAGMPGEETSMPMLQIPPDLDLHYLVDDYTDPWRQPATILMLHGNAESSASWYGWVPTLARRYRLVRPDMRGFGASTPMPRDFPWTIDLLIDDYCRLMDALGVERFHLVAAKIGGTIARAFAARRPERVRTLTVVGTPTPLRVGAEERLPALIEEFETLGVEHWARQTMAGRLGSAFPPAGVEWWTKFMGRTALSTQIGFMRTIACADIRSD